VDFVVKARYFEIGDLVHEEIFVIDYHCVDMLMNKDINPEILLYIFLHILNLYLLIFYIHHHDTKLLNVTWGPPMTQVMVYVTPLLMYSLSMISVNYYIQVIWGVVACMQVFDKLSKVNHLVCCVVVAVFFFGDGIGVQYVIKFYEVELSEIQNKTIIIGMFTLLLIFLNVYNNPHPNYKQNLSKGISDRQKVVAKRDVQDEQSKNRLKSKVVLLLTALLYLLTTSLGNIFILLALYFNIPLFKAKQFLIGIGCAGIVGIALSPEQVSYFIYLYVIVLILGQSVTNEEILQW
jgi:hypothetical protein